MRKTFSYPSAPIIRIIAIVIAFLLITTSGVALLNTSNRSREAARATNRAQPTTSTATTHSATSEIPVTTATPTVIDQNPDDAALPSSSGTGSSGATITGNAIPMPVPAVQPSAPSTIPSYTPPCSSLQGTSSCYKCSPCGGKSIATVACPLADGTSTSPQVMCVPCQGTSNTDTIACL